MRELTVFDRVSIPADYAATQTYAILAKRDGGKTYTTLKLEEQLCDAGQFFVVLDPVGKHWAIRVGEDGRTRGGKSDVYVLGGARGDVPLDPKSGELIADVVVDHPGRYVLDTTSFETDADVDRFALAFAKRLFRRKMKDPGWPLLLILEEAESFIPERPQPGQAPMLGAFGRLMRQGRNHGIGMWLVSQRSQALNKGVLSQAEVLIVKQMAAKRDRDRVKEWAEANGTAEQLKVMMDSLASLEQDEAWVWSPAWLRCFERCKVLRRETFDSSASVKAGHRAASVELTPLDVAALGEKIAAMAKHAEADDPRALRRRITELEREVAAKPASGPDPRLEQRVRVLEQALNDEQGARERASKVIEATHSRLFDLSQDLGNEQRELMRAYVDSPTVTDLLRESSPAQVAAVKEMASRSAPPSQRRPLAPTPASVPANGSLPRAAAEMVEALVGFPSLERDRLALLTGRKPRGGSWNTALRAMIDAGYVVDDGRVLTPTEKARQEFPDARVLGGEDLIKVWRSKLSSSATDIFDELVDAYPSSLTYDEIAERTGKAPRGGSWNTAIKHLRTSGLADQVSPGVLVANSDLMG